MLKLSGFIELPEHLQPGGFDHADIHPASRTLYAFLPQTHSAAVFVDN